MALWSGRFQKETDRQVAEFTESISYDVRLYRYDIEATRAHVSMLASAEIIDRRHADMIVGELDRIEQDFADGQFDVREDLEDIHMNIESALIDRLGEVGARVHTGRSRNDQICTDERMYLRDEAGRIDELLVNLQRALVQLGSDNQDAVLPGLTHMQNAQPVLFAHHLLAYVEMFDRDRGRLADCTERLNVLPLGAGALAGSSLPLDRESVARKLGFRGVLRNSMDAVADRDFSVEFLCSLAIIAMHCSRLAEDVILWVSHRFGFMELDESFCTGSSIMPQKKNPDVAELVRGKTGRVYAALFGMLTLLKGLPMTYNRDLQEDKEGLFDAIDTVKRVLGVLAPMMAGAQLCVARMAEAVSDPGLMATDLAEWLVRQGVPFRDAHRQVGRFVAWCARHGVAMDRATLEQMRETIPMAEKECLELFCPRRSVSARSTPGGTSPERVAEQLESWEARLSE